MKLPIIKRSIVVRGHKNSVSLENDFRDGLKDIALLRRITATELIAQIDAARPSGNFSSMLRVMLRPTSNKRLQKDR